MCASIHTHTDTHTPSNCICQLFQSVHCLFVEKMECVPEVTTRYKCCCCFVMTILTSKKYQPYSIVCVNEFRISFRSVTVTVRYWYWFMYKFFKWVFSVYFHSTFSYFQSLWMVTRWNLYSFVLLVPNGWASISHNLHSYKNRPGCLLLFITCFRKFSWKFQKTELSWFFILNSN